MKSRERIWWLRRIAIDFFHIDIDKNFFLMSSKEIDLLYTLAKICRYKAPNNGKSTTRAFLDYLNSNKNPF